MKIKIIAVGKLKKGPMAELVSEYVKRSRWPLQIIEIDHSDMDREGREILSHIDESDHVILMDERGDMLTSVTFSSYIEKQQIAGLERIVFVIGGAYGLSDDVHQKSLKKLAFGPQTWPHMMVRLMLVEQVYRAEQILAGHPYHKP